ncbi:hypothetical protein [Streptomyces sp. NPDC001312]|uniref:hypothetical protein n=1 Tax=Streptomyces sp. NPDC001312 TaxID=3364561 RepID=UPI0036BF74F9
MRVTGEPDRSRSRNDPATEPGTVHGKAAATKTARRKRAAFNEVLNTAVEKGYFSENPLHGLKSTA